MPSFFSSLPLLRQSLILCCLLLTACATPKSTWDMTESQRIRAANNGNLDAIRHLQSVNYYDKNRNQHYRSTEDQLKWLLKGAELGDGSSQYRLAFHSLYSNEKTLPVPRNPAEALRLAQAAADNMARAGEPGGKGANAKWVEGAKTLADRATTILQQQPLAEKGDANAMYALSQAYAPISPFGLGSIDSSADQAMWLRRAAEAGHPGAIMAMASSARTSGLAAESRFGRHPGSHGADGRPPSRQG